MPYSRSARIPLAPHQIFPPTTTPDAPLSSRNQALSSKLYPLLRYGRSAERCHISSLGNQPLHLAKASIREQPGRMHSPSHMKLALALVKMQSALTPSTCSPLPIARAWSVAVAPNPAVWFTKRMGSLTQPSSISDSTLATSSRQRLATFVSFPQNRAVNLRRPRDGAGGLLLRGKHCLEILKPFTMDRREKTRSFVFACTSVGRSHQRHDVLVGAIHSAQPQLRR